ncbi:hypothetical protein [Rhodothermus marinus]|uniref:Uncharacterized protein n=1 Tax=Rhodothermus marinus (strain ATCC 43812 / DSM 4252 / R-10) TaxID=518766 RepID=D0MKT6_RHOM4|nr:hypothetical protein [Rhodothermus marinus]ACY49750.1 hypothetical protein Rmar_2888 [Rhodothermus marinus DSM 4252]
MARRKKAQREALNDVRDFRHAEARRKNNPPAGAAPTYEARERRTESDPQLVWAGKAEHTSFEVDVVSLHIHERISTSAILRAVQRPEPMQLDLFGETPLPADQEVQFYKHEVGWANRLVLGDSLLIMNSQFTPLTPQTGMNGARQAHLPPPTMQLPAPQQVRKTPGREAGPLKQGLRR